MSSNILYIPILLPLGVGVLALLLPGKVKWIRETFALIVSGVVLAATFWIFSGKAKPISKSLLEIGRFNLRFDLVSDTLSAVILMFVAGFCFLICLYSLTHMRDSKHKKGFYAFLLFALGGSSGVLLADHLLLLLIFWEVVSASLYFLINTGEHDTRAGSTKTFVTLGGVDGCLLLGMGFLWLVSKSFIISDIQVPVDGWLPGLAFILMMIAAITKAGSMPFSSWVPAASKNAPAPVMALLPASIDKLLGIFLLVKLSTSIFVLGSGFGLMLMIIGAITIIAAVMIAVVQHDLRQLLSYHAVSQVGYMILGIGTLTPIGIAGGIFHMINNSLYKSCLFLCCGAVEKKTGTSDLGKLGGLARAMPATFTACIIAALAISGVPPFNGFVSKWMVYQGVLDTGTRYSFIFLVIAMFGSALTLASFVKVIYAVFLGIPTEHTKTIRKDAGISVTIPLGILALLCILFGVYYRLTLDHLVFPGVAGVAILNGIWNSTLASGLLLVGIVLGLILHLIGRFGSSIRVVGAFTGGEVLDEKSGRVNATHFYNTVKSMPGLRSFFRAQEQGNLDPYIWLGKIGLGFTGLLKRVHSGLLPWYLSWILLGTVSLLIVFQFLL